MFFKLLNASHLLISLFVNCTKIRLLWFLKVKVNCYGKFSKNINTALIGGLMFNLRNT